MRASEVIGGPAHGVRVGRESFGHTITRATVVLEPDVARRSEVGLARDEGFLLLGVPRQGGRSLQLFPRLVRTAQAGQQVGPDGMQGVIAVEPLDLVDDPQAGGRAVDDDDVPVPAADDTIDDLHPSASTPPAPAAVALPDPAVSAVLVEAPLSSSAHIVTEADTAETEQPVLDADEDPFADPPQARADVDEPWTIVDSQAEVEHAMELLASGHKVGYLLKSRVTDVADFIDSLERIARGGSVVDPAIVNELVCASRRHDPLAALSAREREVLALMAEGRSNAGIGRQLWVTEGTVEKHVRSILTKLNLPEADDDHRRVRAVIAFLEAR